MGRTVTRKLETTVTAVIITAAVALCVILVGKLNGIRSSLILPLTSVGDMKPPSSAERDSANATLNNLKNAAENAKITESELAEKIQSLGSVKQQYEDKLGAFRKMIDPGSRPAWYYHPADWYYWPDKVAAYNRAKDFLDALTQKKNSLATDIDNLKAKIDSLPEDLANAQNDAQKTFDGLSAKYVSDNKTYQDVQAKKALQKNVLSYARLFFEKIVKPILDFLLLLSLLRLIPRLILRLILIKGWAKTYRV